MTTIEDFELLNVIGQGQFAKVIQVQHLPTRKIMVLKSIKLSKIGTKIE